MLTVQSRSGPGQDFELEFGAHGSALGSFLLVKPSTTFKIAKFYPELSGSETTLRWVEHKGENRLVIDITGMRPMPFDEAPEPLRKALLPWVEKLAAKLRKSQYQD